MAVPFPNHPNLTGGYAPIQMECSALNLVIDGEFPLDLNGTLYRNGPNPQFAPRGSYHLFGGDGMVHAFHIENGRVSYKNRWPRTVKWELENEAGESLFGVFNPVENDPRVAGSRPMVPPTPILSGTVASCWRWLNRMRLLNSTRRRSNLWAPGPLMTNWRGR